MNVLVTGGAGFIGSHLTDRLIREGYWVTVLDDMSSGRTENLNTRANVIQAELTKALGYHLDKKRDVVFHLAAASRIQPSIEDPYRTYSTNVMGTLGILERAKQWGAKVIYAGSSTADQLTTTLASPYAHSKHIGEQLCWNYVAQGVNARVARLYNVYGPRELDSGPNATVVGIFNRLRREGKPLTITGTGEQRRDFVHVHDVVDALMSMMHYDGYRKLFSIGSGRNYSINKVAAMFGGKAEHIPARSGEDEETLADLTYSIALLKYKPKHSLETYIHTGE